MRLRILSRAIKSKLSHSPPFFTANNYLAPVLNYGKVIASFHTPAFQMFQLQSVDLHPTRFCLLVKIDLDRCHTLSLSSKHLMEYMRVVEILEEILSWGSLV